MRMTSLPVLLSVLAAWQCAGDPLLGDEPFTGDIGGAEPFTGDIGGAVGIKALDVGGVLDPPSEKKSEQAGQNKDSAVWSSSSSEVYESDGKRPGRFFVRKQRCKNGHCQETEKRGELPARAHREAKAPQRHAAAGSDKKKLMSSKIEEEGATSDLLDQEAEDMEESTRSMDRNFRRAARHMDDVRRSMDRSFGDVLNSGIFRDDATRDGGGDKFSKSPWFEKAGNPQGLKLRGKEGGSAAEESHSVVTRMVNGHITQKRKDCRNGKCETKTEQRDLPPQKQEQVVPATEGKDVGDVTEYY